MRVSRAKAPHSAGLFTSLFWLGLLADNRGALGGKKDDDANGDDDKDGDDDTADDDKPVTRKELREMVGSSVNAAVSDHLKRDEKKRDKTLKESISSAVAEALKAIKPESKKDDEGDDSGKGKKSPELAAYEQRLKKAEDDLAAEREKSAKADREKRDADARAKVRAELTGKVRAESLEDTVTLLFAKGRVLVDEETGEVTIKARRSPGQGRPAEDMELTLDAGVETVLKEPSMAVFLPAPGGNRGGNDDARSQRRDSGRGGSRGIDLKEVGTGSDEERDNRAAALAADVERQINERERSSRL